MPLVWDYLHLFTFTNSPAKNWSNLGRILKISNEELVTIKIISLLTMRHEKNSLNHGFPTMKSSSVYDSKSFFFGGTSVEPRSDRLGELKCDSRQTELNMSLFFDVKVYTT